MSCPIWLVPTSDSSRIDDLVLWIALMQARHGTAL
jgi:hypothetical protein